MTNKDFTR